MTTTCSLPPALTDQQIWEALDGIADESISSHLQKCPYCQTRANALENMQSRLKSRLFRATCPPSLELAEFFARTLPPPQMLTVSAHVRSCPHCTRELAELGAFMGAQSSEPAEPVGERKTLVARLVNSASSAFGALRGESRSVTLEVEGAVITFEIQSASNGRVSVLGQIAAEAQDAWTGATVILQPSDASQQTTSVNDLGAFTFEAVQPGVGEFIITSLHNESIKIPPLDIHT